MLTYSFVQVFGLSPFTRRSFSEGGLTPVALAKADFSTTKVVYQSKLQTKTGLRLLNTSAACFY